jgi:hypothetical protein
MKWVVRLLPPNMPDLRQCEGHKQPQSRTRCLRHRTCGGMIADSDALSLRTPRKPPNASI